MISLGLIFLVLLTSCSPAEIKLAEQAIDANVKVLDQSIELELEVPSVSQPTQDRKIM